MRVEVRKKDDLLNAEAEKLRELDEALAKKIEENADLSVAKQSAESEVANLKEQLKMQQDKAEADVLKATEEGFSKGWELAIRLVLHRDSNFPWMDVEELLEKDGDEVANRSAKELEVVAEMDRRQAAAEAGAQASGMQQGDASASQDVELSETAHNAGVPPEA